MRDLQQVSNIHEVEYPTHGDDNYPEDDGNLPCISVYPVAVPRLAMESYAVSPQVRREH